jgi:radical SAM protein with 4Fe4S-binding SPASM domain
MNSLKNKLKIVAHPKIAELQRKYHPLRIIFWESTLRCCYSCKHCGLSASNDKEETEIPKKLIKKAFKEIAETQNPKNILVGVTGGEPLLRKDLFEIMKYAKGLGYNWGMVTNGFFVNEQNINKMKEAGMDTVAVSLDGLEKNHNWIRGNKEAFEKAINAIRLLRKANYFKVVEVITTVTKTNINDLDELYELCLSLGVDQWRVMPVAPIGRAAKNRSLELTPKQIAQTIQYIADKRKKSKKLKVTLNEMFFCGPDYEFKARNSGFYCPAGINSLAILSNGDINGCPLIDGMVEGSIYIDNISSLWDNKFKDYRDISWKKNGVCKECEWFEYCGGGELHLRDKQSKKLTQCNYKLIKKYL